PIGKPKPRKRPCVLAPIFPPPPPARLRATFRLPRLRRVSKPKCPKKFLLPPPTKNPPRSTRPLTLPPLMRTHRPPMTRNAGVVVVVVDAIAAAAKPAPAVLLRLLPLRHRLRHAVRRPLRAPLPKLLAKRVLDALPITVRFRRCPSKRSPIWAVLVCAPVPAI